MLHEYCNRESVRGINTYYGVQQVVSCMLVCGVSIAGIAYSGSPCWDDQGAV